MSGPLALNREAEILRLWEAGGALDRWQRDDALLAQDQPAPPELGRRNLGMLELRQRLFERPWSLKASCPNCGAECGFDVHIGALCQQLEATEPAGAVTVEWRGESLRLRAPVAGDLRAIAPIGDPRAAALALLARCTGADLSEASDAELDALGEALGRLDPAALVSFDLTCPECSHRWASLIDIGDAFWRELRHAAEETLLSVDALARVYGWTEAEILALSPMRRAAYLQLGDAP